MNETTMPDAPKSGAVSNGSPPSSHSGRRRAAGFAIIAVIIAAVGAILVIRVHHSMNAAPRITVAPSQQAGGSSGVATSSQTSFDQPKGFTRGTQFRPAAALYSPYGGNYLTLNSEARGQVQVLAVIIYKLPKPVPATDGRRLAFVASIDRRVGARVTAKSSITTVAEEPAVTQDGIQVASADGVTATYKYRTWYVFQQPRTLVQVACQWSTERAAILKGCNQLIGSLSVS